MQATLRVSHVGAGGGTICVPMCHCASRLLKSRDIISERQWNLKWLKWSHWLVNAWSQFWILQEINFVWSVPKPVLYFLLKIPVRCSKSCPKKCWDFTAAMSIQKVSHSLMCDAVTATESVARSTSAICTDVCSAPQSYAKVKLIQCWSILNCCIQNLVSQHNLGVIKLLRQTPENPTYCCLPTHSPHVAKYFPSGTHPDKMTARGTFHDLR